MIDRTEWLARRGWGVMIHFLATGAGVGDAGVSPTSWNRRVDGFDVDALAHQASGLDVGYLMISVGQGSGHYCAPNRTYDSLVRSTESKCSRRDLVAELADALRPYDIPLLVYVPADGSWGDPEARTKLGMTHHWNDCGPDYQAWATYDWAQDRCVEFMENWEHVVREWSIRWGDDVKGWWVDGCFKPEIRYPDNAPPNFETLRAALKAGNPAAIVAFNPAVHVPIISCTRHEDFTAGETSESLAACPGAWVDNNRHKARFHVLNHLGEDWGTGEPRFSGDLVKSYTEYVMSRGGIVTWDVPVTSHGLIPHAYVDQLS